MLFVFAVIFCFCIFHFFIFRVNLTLTFIHPPCSFSFPPHTHTETFLILLSNIHCLNDIARCNESVGQIAIRTPLPDTAPMSYTETVLCLCLYRDCIVPPSLRFKTVCVRSDRAHSLSSAHELGPCCVSTLAPRWRHSAPPSY